jgi:hypothetical protein
MKKYLTLFLTTSLIGINGFCGLQDAYSMSGIDGRNTSFLQRVEAGMVTAALNVVSETANDVQTVTITGAPTGGTFTLTYNSSTTAAIAFNAAAGNVQLALSTLPGVGTNNVLVTGGPGPSTAFTVTFLNVLGNNPIGVMTAAGSFTGGSSPSVSVVHTTTGSGFVNHLARLSLATRILNNPNFYAPFFALAAATNATLQTDFPAPNYTQSGSVTTAQADNDIQFVVNGEFNAFL